MTMLRQTDNDYVIDYVSRSGDKWTYHFRAEQVDYLRLLIAEHVLRENLCPADFQYLDFALQDIKAMDRLPPLPVPAVEAKPSLLQRVADALCDLLCLGK